MELGNLLAVDHFATFRFFYSGLRETRIGELLPKPEVKYLASVLGHYAQCSVGLEVTHTAVPRNLAEVFEQYCLTDPSHGDVDSFETAGSQCLFLVGFFSGQMRGRHNIHWFERRGQSFYFRASRRSLDPSRRQQLLTASLNFRLYTGACHELQGNLRDAPYLLR